jgi:hypothetical protein
MAATQIPLTFRAAPLPTNFKGTPQEFADALVARLSAESANDISFFAAGTVAPTSNVGPWLKNDQIWYVWSDPLATYIPQILESESLRYVASNAAPDQNKYIFWIELDGTGKAIAIKYFSGGVWKDVYEDKFALYSTTAQMTAAIAAAKTELQVNYPVAARSTGPGQIINVDGTNQVLALPSNYIDPDTVYNTVDSKYVAEVSGIYEVSFAIQIDNVDADPAAIEFSANVVKNNIFGPPSVGTGYSVPTPSGARWFPTTSGLVQMNAGDFIQLQLSATDGLSGNTVSVSNTSWFIHLVRKT